MDVVKLPIFIPTPFSYVEKIRLDSFTAPGFEWEGRIPKELLAKSGFYSMRYRDRIHCGFCTRGIEDISDGTSIDDIKTKIHSEFVDGGHDCPLFVQTIRNKELNISIGDIRRLNANLLGNYTKDQAKTEPDDFPIEKAVGMIYTKFEFFGEEVLRTFLYIFLTQSSMEDIQSIFESKETWQHAPKEDLETHIKMTYYMALSVWAKSFGRGATFRRMVELIREYFSIRKEYTDQWEKISAQLEKELRKYEKNWEEQEDEPVYSFLELNFEFVHEAPIGRGAYGKVFQVRHKADRKHYALKYFGMLEDEEENEANVLALLKPHPHIVRYVFAWYENEMKEYKNRHITPGPEKFLFIQMEFCSGGDMRAWLSSARDVKVRKKTGKVLFEQLVSAVCFIHGTKPKPIVHRDIKPENIFLETRADGTLCTKLGDFGLAREVCTLDMSSRRGTPFYKAPEMRRRGYRKYDQRVDIYSMGKIYYEIYANLNLAADEEGWVDGMENIEKFVFVANFTSENPEKLAIIKTMLEPEYELRCTAIDIQEYCHSETSKGHD